MKNQSHAMKPNQLPKYWMGKEWFNSSSCETDQGFQLSTNHQEIYANRATAKNTKATSCCLAKNRPRNKEAAALLCSAVKAFLGSGLQTTLHKGH